MPLSYIQTIGDGVTETFTVPFPYISRAHVGMTVDGYPVSFVWLNPQLVRTSPAPHLNAVVEVRRTTPRDNVLVDFVDGSTLTEGDLDTATLQSFYLAQESFDAAGGTLGVNSDGTYSAFNRRISSLGDPVNGGDAVNKRTFDTALTNLKAQTAEDRVATGEDRKAVFDIKVETRTLKDEASRQALLAYLWANAPANEAVTEDNFSAYHWAMKAKASVGVEAESIPFKSTPLIVADNVQDAFAEVDKGLTDVVTAVADALDKKHDIGDPVLDMGGTVLSAQPAGLTVEHTGGTQSATFQHDGNINGPVWGGYLSNWVLHQLSGERTWVYNSFLTDIRLTGWWEDGMVLYGWAYDPGGGAVLTSLHGAGPIANGAAISNRGGRFLQKCIGGQWYSVGTWG